jgi:GT2 family glycosyltransferase
VTGILRGDCHDEKITFVSLPMNVGFPCACNIGMKVARGDALLLLNNDVVVTENWLSNMVECLCSSREIGIVGPCANQASGNQQVELVFNSLEEFLEMAKPFNEPNPELWRPIDRLVGFCFLIKRELMERIGYLDKQFAPGYYEDDDYCHRAKQAGYELRIAGDVLVYHRGTASFNKRDPLELSMLIVRNHRKFTHKWGLDPTIYI